MILVL
jgi:hypothetical protein